jgi:hypothetical protein
MFDPAFPGIDLGKLFLLDPDDVLFMIKKNRPGTGGSLIQGQDVSGHENTPLYVQDGLKSATLYKNYTTEKRARSNQSFKFVFPPAIYYTEYMKNMKRLGFLITGFFIFLLAAACTSEPPPAEEKDYAEFQLRKIAVSVLLFPEQINGSPRMNFNLNILDASGPEGMEEFFRNLLYDGQTVDKYKETLIECYRTAYHNMREVVENRPETPPEHMDWEYSESMDIRTFSDLGMVIGRDKESYTGGAHGMTQKVYYVIDLEEQRALDWREFFTDPESPELYAIVLDGLREYAGLEKNAPLSSGIYFDNEPEMSDNFFPTFDGLGLRWNPYEIGPYSAGAIEIVISWNKIRNLLSDKGLAVLDAFKENV